jgi:cytoplasmic iron level regulating protein YaaA (DUF328/UPF0246 family)
MKGNVLMLAIMSPARNIRPVSLVGVEPDRPLFQSETRRLADVLRGYSPWELESLLDVNPQRAFDFYDFYQRFDSAAPGTPVLLAYYGAAFRNLNAQELNLDGFFFAQEHLRILSAFYGLLRPADGILPYRFGIKRDFKINGQDLYAFWGDRLYRELYKGGGPVVNLTSVDYARLVTPYLAPEDILITCRFLVQKPGGARGTVSTVRTARGQMARYLIKNRITQPEGLKAFDWEGYRFIESRSDDFNYIFIQDIQEQSCI